MKLKERLKQLRLKNNCTAKQLAKYLNFGGTAISNYESGRNEPSIDTLIKIADYFDVTIDYLVGRTDILNENSKNCIKLCEILSLFSDDEINKIINILIYIKKTDNK